MGSWVYYIKWKLKINKLSTNCNRSQDYIGFTFKKSNSKVCAVRSAQGVTSIIQLSVFQCYLQKIGGKSAACSNIID